MMFGCELDLEILGITFSEDCSSDYSDVISTILPVP